MAQDYYDVLGVPRTATQAQIKKAFYKKAQQTHPDVSDAPDAAEKFKEINEAYSVLSDDTKRQRYDRFGHAGVNGAGGAGAGFAGFEDIFETFFTGFGGQQRRRGTQRGGDLRVDVQISFEEAAFGVEKEIEFQRLETCDVCDGSGARAGSAPITCPECQGRGEQRIPVESFLGTMMRVVTCPRCGGKGKIVENPCTNCDGNGRRRQKVTQTVTIPGGVSSGLQLILKGEADAGEKGAPRGNLGVTIHVKDHAYFKRRDSDIILDLPINVAQATLGDKISVPTLDGDVEMTIPHGTQTGKVFRLRGKGVPRLRSDGTSHSRGDQLVYITVEVPTRLTDRQRELFQELAETMDSQVSPQTDGRGFFDRVMDFFGAE